MSNVIEQQLIYLLQPLLDVTLQLKGQEAPTGEFADLEIASVSTIGMASETGQSVDEQGNLTVYASYRAEIAVRYFGEAGVIKLSTLANKLQYISVSEQFQKVNIGIGRLGDITPASAVEKSAEPAADAAFRFFIHYTVASNDAVGVIEHINAAHDSGEITIHLTR